MTHIHLLPFSWRFLHHYQRQLKITKFMTFIEKNSFWRRNHNSNVWSSTLLPTGNNCERNFTFVANDFDERVPYFFRFWFMKFLKFHLPPSTFLKIVFLTRPFFPKCNFCLSFLLENRYVANIVSKKWRKSRLQKNWPATNSKFPNQQRVVVVPLFDNDSSRGAKVCKELTYVSLNC